MKKSKWGKLFKDDKDDGSGTADRKDSFKLNEDVVDFLKPSTEKAGPPKLNIAVAQRYPGAHAVKPADALSPPPQLSTTLFNGKPKRRKNLTVSFAQTPPEIMGEGGDEAPDPPNEISRMKAAISRSMSDRRSGGGPGTFSRVNTFGDVQPNVPFQQQQQQRGPFVRQNWLPQQAAGGASANDDDFIAGPLRRANTSHNESSPAMQRKFAAPSTGTHQHKPSLTRVPTGFEAYVKENSVPTVVTHSTADDDRPPSRARPTVNTQWSANDAEDVRDRLEGGENSLAPRKQYLGLSSPTTPLSPAAMKAREMRTNEGAAFRRASTMIIPDDDDDDEDINDKPPWLREPQQPQPQQQPQQQQPQQPLPTSESQRFPPRTASNVEHEIYYSIGTAVSSDHSSHPQRSNFDSPSSTNVSPTDQNPFADPKFMKRNSRETASDSLNSSMQAMALGRGQGQHRGAPMEGQHAPSQPTSSSHAYPQPPSAQPRQQWPLNRDQGQGSLSSSQPPASQVQQRPPQNHSRPFQRPEPYDQRFTSQIQGPQRPARPDEYPAQPPPGVAPQHRTPNPDQGQQRYPGAPMYSEGAARPKQSLDGGMMQSRTVPSPYGGTSSPAGNNEPMRSRGDTYPQARDRMVDPSNASGTPRQFTNVANGNNSPTSLHHLSPRIGHSRNSSQDGSSPRVPPHASPASQHVTSPRFPNQFSSPNPQSQTVSPQSSFVAPPRTASTLDPRQQHPDERQGQRDGPATSRTSPGSSSASEHNPAAEAALGDFASRVAHMKGVFSLTAEKERPRDQCTPSAWLRTALWWFLKGKAGVDSMLRSRSQTPDSPRRELLTQPHVDLAKSWWILFDPLSGLVSDGADHGPSADSLDASLRRSALTLSSNIKSVCLMMGRNGLLPPTHALIQGQDTRIWLQYPRFRHDVVSILNGAADSADPHDLLPLSDTREAFCYGRFPAEVFLNTDDAETDRVILPCMLSLTRSRNDYPITITIASQSDLVSVRVSPRSSDRASVTWQDVSWKASARSLVVQLPQNIYLSVRMDERDFRYAYNLAEYAHGVERGLNEEGGEKLVHEARLTELQYADAANPHAFPADKLRGCTALVYERTEDEADANGVRKKHRGFRLLLLTDASHKTLSSVSHDVCRTSPLYFEYLNDAAANGAAAMVLRLREDNRQCRALLVFGSAGARQVFYDVLTGLMVGQDETIVEKITLSSMNIEPATAAEGGATGTSAIHPALQGLQWQRLGVTNSLSDDDNNRLASTVESDSLRILARHSAGCITDRVNLSKGEFLFRLPPSSASLTTIQLLRQPQSDLSLSIDTRTAAPTVADAAAPLLNLVQSSATLRSYTFATPADLHAFQASVTGYVVRFDAIATTLSIARRRMVVPIYKKWEATQVRVQVVYFGNQQVARLIAFMDGFSHADALCFQVKGTDVFEHVKASKGTPAAVKLVDAKFSLPPQDEHHRHHRDDKAGDGGPGADEARMGRLRRRFVNLEGLEYAEEHDDITVGFADEAERDRFVKALPAATNVSRGITLKRRI